MVNGSFIDLSLLRFAADQVASSHSVTALDGTNRLILK